jgi:hypothetical protein
MVSVMNAPPGGASSATMPAEPALRTHGEPKLLQEFGILGAATATEVALAKRKRVGTAHAEKTMAPSTPLIETPGPPGPTGAAPPSATGANVPLT